jgi:hexokinase
MALVEASKRVAAEFDLADDDVRKTVAEFIAEMSAYNQSFKWRNKV